MNIDRYRQLLKEYRPAARSEKDYIKRAVAKEEWEAITRNSRKSEEHELAYATYIMEGKR